MEVTTIIKVDLDKLMKKKGLTLYQLSRDSGVDYSYLHKAKNGYIKLSNDAWEKIKKVLDK